MIRRWGIADVRQIRSARMCGAYGIRPYSLTAGGVVPNDPQSVVVRVGAYGIRPLGRPLRGRMIKQWGTSTIIRKLSRHTCGTYPIPPPRSAPKRPASTIPPPYLAPKRPTFSIPPAYLAPKRPASVIPPARPTPKWGPSGIPPGRRAVISRANRLLSH